MKATLKEMPRAEALILDALNSPQNFYDEAKKLVFFGSTYLCQQAFSCTNLRCMSRSLLKDVPNHTPPNIAHSTPAITASEATLGKTCKN